VELHFVDTMPPTKAKIQGPKGSAMYADVQNNRRKDSCKKCDIAKFVFLYLGKYHKLLNCSQMENL
jgi:hypothetical protein